MAPLDASASAAVRPRPVPPPVTRATLPVRSNRVDAVRDDIVLFALGYGMEGRS